MSISREFEAKRVRISDYLTDRGLEAAFLKRQDRFAWASCGSANYVNTATEAGTAVLYVPIDGDPAVITTNIEATRISAEEPIAEIAEIRRYPWHDSAGAARLARELAAGHKAVADFPLEFAHELEPDFDELRYSLLAEEVDRLETLAADCGAVIEKTAMNVEPGTTELNVAGDLSRECWSLGIVPIVVLVAADARLSSHRHPLPTTNPAKRVVMIVLCGRRAGLIVSVTRIVHFGAPSDDLVKRHRACMEVDAAAIAATRPGATMGEVFAKIQKAYARSGYPNEWELHHQGGPCGYATRDFVAARGDGRKIVPNQAFAWNPSITGTKTEDTILATTGGARILSASANWPLVEIESLGRNIPRPAILTR